MKLLAHILATAALAVLFAGATLGGNGPPDHSAVPSLEVKMAGGDWASELSAESDPTENVLYLKLTNTGESAAQFRFEGPGTDADWQVTYFREGGEETSNKFNLRLDAGESEIVTVRVEERGAPRNYLFATFSLTRKGGPPWGLPPGPPPHVPPGPPHGLPPGPPPGVGKPPGATATAKANLIVPADVMLQISGAADYVGENVLAANADPWQLAQKSTTTIASRRTASYSVNIQNVWNASVSYLLRENREENYAYIARYYLDGEEITRQIRSPEGYRTPTLEWGEQLLLTVKVTPVGTSRAPRTVVITSQVAEITEPMFDIASFSRFDGVIASTGLLTLTKVRTTRWQEERPGRLAQ